MKTQRGELGSRIKGRLVMSWTLGTCGEGGGKGGGMESINKTLGAQEDR